MACHKALAGHIIPLMDGQFLAIGRIKRAVGLKGQVLIKAYSQADSFIQPACFFIKKGNRYIKFHIEGYRRKKDKEFVCTLREIDDRTGAESIEKQVIFQKVDLLPDTEEDEFYWYEIEGLEVLDDRLGNIGVIEKVIETGANDVLVIRRGDGEFMIPMVDEIVKTIDLKQGKCIVDMPPGLMEATFLSDNRRNKGHKGKG